MRNSSLAVCPKRSMRRRGSPRPGTCTRMRSAPWRWIVGSTKPSSLMRFSTIGIDCSIVWRMRSVTAASVGVSRISPPPASATSRVRWPLPCSTPPSGCDKSRSLASAPWKSAPSRSLTSTLLPRTIGGVDQLMRASRSVRRTSSRSESQALLAHVSEIDLEEDLRAALQIEAEHQPPLRPCRPALDHLLGKEIGHGEAAHQGRRHQNGHHFPSCEIQHVPTTPQPPAQPAALSSFTGSPLARTSATILRG